jgi:hypothetical protein
VLEEGKESRDDIFAITNRTRQKHQCRETRQSWFSYHSGPTIPLLIHEATLHLEEAQHVLQEDVNDEKPGKDGTVHLPYSSDSSVHMMLEYNG